MDSFLDERDFISPSPESGSLAGYKPSIEKQMYEKSLVFSPLFAVMHFLPWMKRSGRRHALSQAGFGGQES